MNAETRVLEFRRRRDEMLQWGRVLMNAETWYLNLRTPRVRIASMGPRSHERGNIPPLWLGSRPCGSLQWGRVLMNAETARALRCPQAHELASMGPRSHERGNKSDGLLHPGIKRLQWGRVLMNAETDFSVDSASV